MNGSGFAVIQDREELEPAKRQRTGINLLIVEMESKRIELIRQLAPTNSVFAVLVNPKSADADVQLKAVQSAAHALNEQIKIFNVSNEVEVERAFAKFREDGIGGSFLLPTHSS